MPVLDALVAALRLSTVEVIDLTAPLSADTPVIKLPEPFGNTIPLALQEISRYDDRGPGWYWNNISTGEHTGTHFDAPVHWITGRDGLDVAQVPAAHLIAPAVVLDFSAEAAADPDFLLEVDHIRKWEGEHGSLPEGGWLLYRTGWDVRSASQEQFLNANETGPHTPGVSVECARWLADHAPILGFGVETVGAVLAEFGADTVFGVVGSGNFHVTNALIARGARFVPARHECGAASMADGWARTTGRPGIVSVHQGPGLTNAMTGITEAAKSRTPLVVLAADVASAAVRSNFRIDVAGLASAVGAVPARLHSPDFAVDDTVRAYRTAVAERRTVILALPLDVQAGQCPLPPAELLNAARTGTDAAGRGLAGAARDQARGPGRRAQLLRDAAGPEAAARLADALSQATRPVFVAGRGARNARARAKLEQLADHCGALLATSAAAKGLFRGNPWDLDVSGGFATPLAAELIGAADLI